MVYDVIVIDVISAFLQKFSRRSEPARQKSTYTKSKTPISMKWSMTSLSLLTFNNLIVSFISSWLGSSGDALFRGWGGGGGRMFGLLGTVIALRERSRSRGDISTMLEIDPVRLVGNEWVVCPVRSLSKTSMLEFALGRRKGLSFVGLRLLAGGSGTLK